jgi:hypothetical protein
MTPLAALVLVPALVQTPALVPNVPDAVPGSAIERLDTLRCLLLQRDRETRARAAICSMPPVILGQWRN